MLHIIQNSISTANNTSDLTMISVSHSPYCISYKSWFMQHGGPTGIGILQNRFRFEDNFLILYSMTSIWDAMHDRLSHFR